MCHTVTLSHVTLGGWCEAADQSRHQVTWGDTHSYNLEWGLSAARLTPGESSRLEIVSSECSVLSISFLTHRLQHWNDLSQIIPHTFEAEIFSCFSSHTLQQTGMLCQCTIDTQLVSASFLLPNAWLVLPTTLNIFAQVFLHSRHILKIVLK